MRARHGKTLVTCVVGVTLSCLFSFGAVAQENPELPVLSAKNSQSIAKEIEPALQQFVDQQERLPTQAKQVLVKVTPDIQAGIVWIDLDSGYLPRGISEFTEGFGEKVREVENEGYELIEGVVKFRYIRVRIGGKNLNEIYPPEHLKKKRASVDAAAVPVEGLVVLNPGHGKYLNHEDETWRYQRPTLYVGTTDIYEDVVTPGYSSMLASLLTERSANTATSIKHTRDIGNTNVDPESGLAWAALGARYYLKRLYPALGATIWNKFPNGSPDRKQPDRANLREYDDDIRARPEYANYINADTLISLHTDASTNTSARGATVIANVDDSASNQLGQNILCYVTEQIRQLPAYSTYPIRPGVRDGASYGEVRVAAMPTALIEVGFHTNADDSIALRNSVFRAAAMRGVEKGYRTFKAGETTCLPFKIASIPTASGKFRVRFPVPVTLQGHPRFPVTVVTVPVSCPSTWTCGSKTNSFTKAVDNVVTPTYYCDAPSTKPAASFKWKTTVKDADGVVTAAVEHMTSCSAGT